MDRESYELAENAVVPFHVILGFYILYCFAYYFNVYIYVHTRCRTGLDGTETFVSNLNTSELVL